MKKRNLEHKLGDKLQPVFNMLLDGHTHWHYIVRYGRLGRKESLLAALIFQRNLIERAIHMMEAE